MVASGGSTPRGLRPIGEVARGLGLEPESIVPYGQGCAKVPLSTLASVEASRSARAKLVLVTSMTPTTHGEGKTVTSIGLAMALHRMGLRSTVCLRQPSLGPTLGLKGGGAGGGASSVEPANLLNLGFPGDTAWVSSAHNLLSAMVDNHLFQGVPPMLDEKRIFWPRTMDMDDRALRRIQLASDAKGRGVPREDGFVITAASEVMAILGLSWDFRDLKERLARTLVGVDRSGKLVTARDMNAPGAMAALLRDALYPNLVQTSEGTPAFVHTGPFANIAHGTASLVSLRTAQALSEICLVEGGFGSDLGAEKFIDLVSPLGRLKVDAAVVVVTLPALRHHGGAAKDRVGTADRAAVEAGLPNLQQHLSNVRTLGLRAVVVLNRFPGDSQEELDCVAAFCQKEGVPWAPNTSFVNGGAGTLEAAQLVLDAARSGSNPRPLYDAGATPEAKLDTIAQKIYGAEGVDLTPEALAGLEEVRAFGMASLPLCVAKTPLSLSDDAKRFGRPKGFRIKVNRITPHPGAGYLVAETGEVNLMPGLPKVPAAECISLSDQGEITGVR